MAVGAMTRISLEGIHLQIVDASTRWYLDSGDGLHLEMKQVQRVGSTWARARLVEVNMQ